MLDLLGMHKSGLTSYASHSDRVPSFSTPEICKQIIEQYNGKHIGEEGSTLSIRFADTPKQKELKTVTAERRQYKANEYNVAVYSPGSPYLSGAAPTYQSPLQTRSIPGAYWPGQTAHQLASM